MKASTRAKVEHPFRVIKCQFGSTKVRYRNLAKNTAQLVTLLALSNLWMAHRQLIGTKGECACISGKRSTETRKGSKSDPIRSEIRCKHASYFIG